MESGLEDRNNDRRRSGDSVERLAVSMESGLEDRNNSMLPGCTLYSRQKSQWSPA